MLTRAMHGNKFAINGLKEKNAFKKMIKIMGDFQQLDGISQSLPLKFAETHTL